MEKKEIILEEAKYITKKQWEKKYPPGSGGYRVEGAIGKKLKTVKGKLYIGKDIIEYYELPNKFTRYKVKKYLQIGEDEYLAVLKLRVIEWIILALLIPCIVYPIILYKNIGPNIDPGSNKYAPDIEISDQIDPERIVIPGFSDIKLKANTDIAYVALWNPDRNPCYFKFIISLDETGEIIYESKLIPPGEAVTTVKLKKTMPSGITKGVVQIEAFSLENYKTRMNGGEVNVKFIGMETAEDIKEE